VSPADVQVSQGQGVAEMSPEDRRLRSFPLTLATKGQRLLVAALTAERRLMKRLGDLGLRRGTEIEVMHCQGDGSLVVLRHNARLALGARTASGILVTPVDVAAPQIAPGAGG
jgi:Fe2+ transport system protein FeoA